MKNLKYPRKLALLGAISLSVLFAVPSTASAVETTATLTIIETVINDNGGTMTSADFVLRIRDLNGDVVGSPFNGASGAGTTFILPAGSYLITEDDLPYVDGFPQYTSVFSGPAGIDSGYVTLEAGDNVTVVRTNNDWPQAGPAAPVVTPTPVPTTPTETPTTVDGGTLPATGTPWYNMLLVGFGLILLGGVGFGTRKVLN
ncbi:MAG: LPXTG cell wall anchor domain-containing protein [Candidatus Nanopelagicaceae bacterium]|nr:LPXTG cell wall anchor domain-containing protein [Candidatus Nanopelagicaceae bacterium]